MKSESKAFKVTVLRVFVFRMISFHSLLSSPNGLELRGTLQFEPRDEKARLTEKSPYELVLARS